MDFRFRFWISDYRIQILDFSRFKIFYFIFSISYFIFLISGFRGISDSGFFISVDLRFQIQISCFGRFWISDFKFWISDSDFGFQITEFRFWISVDFIFLISYFSFLISCFRGISDSGFLISVDLRFQIQISCSEDFGFLISEFQI